ncbi:MAG TPA: TetR/AcrR family transcriptional regulator [Solirubrobacteraceae bacterium]|nr:TetR/AcrR family transcriptional regulator [Solirubrobacteraceae bacterium]
MSEPPIPILPSPREPRVRGHHLRGQILRRAGDLASIDGLEQVSIARLATAMGMSKSGLYAYFTSKQDLQLATIDAAWAIFSEHVLEPGDDGVEALLERWISYYEREVFAGGCVFVTAGMEFANRDGPVHDALAAAIERQIAALEQALRSEHGNGGDPAQHAFELHALLTGANHRFRISRDRAAFAQGRVAVARVLARS